MTAKQRYLSDGRKYLDNHAGVATCEADAAPAFVATVGTPMDSPAPVGKVRLLSKDGRLIPFDRDLAAYPHVTKWKFERVGFNGLPSLAAWLAQANTHGFDDYYSKLIVGRRALISGDLIGNAAIKEDARRAKTDSEAKGAASIRDHATRLGWLDLDELAAPDGFDPFDGQELVGFVRSLPWFQTAELIISTSASYGAGSLKLRVFFLYDAPYTAAQNRQIFGPYMKDGKDGIKVDPAVWTISQPIYIGQHVVTYDGAGTWVRHFLEWCKAHRISRDSYRDAVTRGSRDYLYPGKFAIEDKDPFAGLRVIHVPAVGEPCVSPTAEDLAYTAASKGRSRAAPRDLKATAGRIAQQYVDVPWQGGTYDSLTAIMREEYEFELASNDTVNAGDIYGNGIATLDRCIAEAKAAGNVARASKLESYRASLSGFIQWCVDTLKPLDIGFSATDEEDEQDVPPAIAAPAIPAFAHPEGGNFMSYREAKEATRRAVQSFFNHAADRRGHKVTGLKATVGLGKSKTTAIAIAEGSRRHERFKRARQATWRV